MAKGGCQEDGSFLEKTVAIPCDAEIMPPQPGKRMEVAVFLPQE